SQVIEAQLGHAMGRTVVLERNDLAVTHVQLLANAVVLYGTVNYGQTQAAYTSLVYLNGSGEAQVFMNNPFNQPPSQDEIAQQDALNSAIVQVGGSTDNP